MAKSMRATTAARGRPAPAWKWPADCGWRCGTIATPTASAKHIFRALARRWFARSVEIVDHDRHLSRLTTQTSPTLREGFGIGADTAAERLIIFGDTPDRMHAEAAFAKRCGACPIPASTAACSPRRDAASHSRAGASRSSTGSDSAAVAPQSPRPRAGAGPGRRRASTGGPIAVRRPWGHLGRICGDKGPEHQRNLAQCPRCGCGASTRSRSSAWPCSSSSGRTTSSGC